MNRIIDKLVIVPGHTSFLESVQSVQADMADDRHWALQSFQKGESRCYVEHIRQGIEIASKVGALLSFSSGRTRLEPGRWSEAATYFTIARNEEHDVTREVESCARDSFENLQFSIYQFHRLLGHYPVQTTVVGWGFKKERFEAHAEALCLDEKSFAYVGCNNPSDLNSAITGEAKTIAQFHATPFGDQGSLLDKRLACNPFNETHPYDTSMPIVADT